MTQVARDRLYHRHRFPVEVIAHAVWLYLRFPLSLRMVEDLLMPYGIIASHQTVCLWVEKFGRHFANRLPGLAIASLPHNLSGYSACIFCVRISGSSALLVRGGAFFWGCFRFLLRRPFVIKQIETRFSL